MGLAAGVAVVVVGLLLWPTRSGTARAPIRTAVPFELSDVRPDRPPVTLSGAPRRPVIVNFFAAWCDPCHAELPRIAALQRQRQGQFEVVGVDVQDNRDLAEALLRDAGVAFPAGYDPDHSVSDAWGVDGLPVTVFVAGDGSVVDYHRGELSTAALDRLAAHLLVTGASTEHRQS